MMTWLMMMIVLVKKVHLGTQACRGTELLLGFKQLRTFAMVDMIGGVLVCRARTKHFFLTFSHPSRFLPPPHQTIRRTFSLCLRLWPIFCTQFMTMARVWLEVVAVPFCVVEFSWECCARSAYTFVCWQLLEPQFWPLFTSLLFHTRSFYASCALRLWHILNCHPFSAILAHLQPVLWHVFLLQVDYDDGESPDVVYVHNATNRQVDCYTLQSRFQPSWPLPCYLREQCCLWFLFMSEPLLELCIHTLGSSRIRSMAYE